MHLTTLTLTSFRNHTQYDLRDLTPGFTAFIGPNGAGKTNILEGISLLAPGRGLRSADIADIQPLGRCDPWSVHADITGRYGPQSLGVGLDATSNRRRVHVNGAAIKSAADAAIIMNAVWLTPREDRLFIDGAAARRKWLDRWVFTADPAHAGRITRLDRLLAERNRLLALPRPDALWLDALEDDLAATALAVTLARADYIDRLQGEIARATSNDFPMPTLALQGFMEGQIGAAPAVHIETMYRQALMTARVADAASGATRLGPHRSDIAVAYATKNMPAAQCSTGEQKALLFALFLAHARLITREQTEPPVLLLDEITAHLDPARRGALFDHLSALGAQVFLTATTYDQVSDAPGVRIEQLGDGITQIQKEVA